ncbi:hypothetical protein K2173_009253 [Erythroxylum novogranatense]|uniref:Kinesin-like protein n=1 Tax=Erythroxylum novogranatense TaxID=1862640 RepID=A0AAV8S5P4_9ROSI|nr:hypothetical protein K2173_009253 [Erythroxylum novogranatense]
MVGAATNGRFRHAFSVVSSEQEVAPNSAPTSITGSEYGGIEFTREDVYALLNERMKYKNKYNYKERCENMMDYIKRLRLCIRWFQELEGSYLFEQEKLQNALEFTESKCAEMELILRNKEEELNLIIVELRKSLASGGETLKGRNREAAMDSLAREKEARVNIEKSQTSLSEELGKVRGELQSSNQRITSINDMYKLLQEYNSSLQTYNSKLQTDLDSAHETNLSNLMGQYNSLQDQYTSCKESLDDVVKQKEALLNEVTSLRREMQEVRDDRDRQQLKMQALTTEVAKYEHLDVKSNELEARCLTQGNQLRAAQDQLEAAENKLRASDLSAFETRTEFEAQKKLICDLQGRLEDAELKLVEGEKLWKKLHNTILRPSLPDDSPAAEAKFISYPTTTESFAPDASQEDVFTEISQLVQSALDGYKVCIFAYGQTGSGKTYTMMGKPEQIFQTRQSLQLQGWKYEMQKMEVGKQYAIKHDANGNTHASDLTVVDVHSTREVSYLWIGLLSVGKYFRSVGKTQMNEQSSRSHFVFTLRISGINESTDQQLQGVLNLIDLAGSERLSKSGSTGERLKETQVCYEYRNKKLNFLLSYASFAFFLVQFSSLLQAINKSLSSLSDVIFALAKKEDHVPFRNSKLTYLLQPCLGGDSKTLMFVNISPEVSSSGESLCSLRFASRVNACEIGTPRRQTYVRSSESRLSLG